MKLSCCSRVSVRCFRYQFEIHRTNVSLHNSPSEIRTTLNIRYRETRSDRSHLEFEGNAEDTYSLNFLSREEGRDYRIKINSFALLLFSRHLREYAQPRTYWSCDLGRGLVIGSMEFPQTPSSTSARAKPTSARKKTWDCRGRIARGYTSRLVSSAKVERATASATTNRHRLHLVINQRQLRVQGTGATATARGNGAGNRGRMQSIGGRFRHAEQIAQSCRPCLSPQQVHRAIQNYPGAAGDSVSNRSCRDLPRV